MRWGGPQAGGCLLAPWDLALLWDEAAAPVLA